MVMVMSMRWLLVTSAVLLAACGEWTGVTLHKPGIPDPAVCLKEWGPRHQPAEIQSLRECIQACQAQGFALDNPADLPQAPDLPPSRRALWVPKACEGPAGAARGKAPMPVSSSSAIKP